MSCLALPGVGWFHFEGEGVALVEAAVDTELYILAFFLAVIFVSLAVLYFWRSHGREVEEAYTRKLLECLQPADHLPSLVFPGTEYSFNRRILIRLLSELTVVISGVEGRILRLIFRENRLYTHILCECCSGNNYRKIRILSIFQDIPLPEELSAEVERFHDSRNAELRMISLLIRLNSLPEQMMARLAAWPHKLSDRDCANLYALAERRGVPLNEVEKLLDSTNPSVVRFGQRILKWKGLAV